MDSRPGDASKVRWRAVALRAGTDTVEDMGRSGLSGRRRGRSSSRTDEMLFCFFLLTADKTEDLIHTIFDNLGHDLKQPRKTVKDSP